MTGETAKNAARERSRVKSLRAGFQRLQAAIPSIPPDTKLSKLDVLILATSYISQLTDILARDDQGEAIESPPRPAIPKFLHPVKKWPMRSRLYVADTTSTPSTSSPDPLTPVTSPELSSDSSQPQFDQQEAFGVPMNEIQTVTFDEGNFEWDFLSYDFTLDSNVFAETATSQAMPLATIDLDMLVNL